jgi:GNAT superfamily N-acetyltransferase
LFGNQHFESQSLSFLPLNRQGLLDYLASPLFAHGTDVAISVHRAQSHLANPRLKPEDVLLILAIEQNELVGYCGMLPDDAPDEQMLHFAWYSCFWVRPDQRGKGLGMQLLKHAMRCWNDKLILTDFVPSTQVFYQKTDHFDQVHVQPGYRWYFRSDLAAWLPPKSAILAKLKPMLKMLDRIANSCLSLLRIGNTANNVFPFKTWTPNHETAAFIEQHSGHSPFKRGQEEWLWIQQFPWVLQGRANDNDRRYYFSSKAEVFDCQVFDLKDDEGNRVALVMLMLRNGSLKMPHVAYFAGAERYISDLVREYCRSRKVTRFVCNQPQLAAYLKQNRIGEVFCKPYQKAWIVSKVLTPYIKGVLADGDGDAAFT